MGRTTMETTNHTRRHPNAKIFDDLIIHGNMWTGGDDVVFESVAILNKYGIDPLIFDNYVWDYAVENMKAIIKSTSSEWPLSRISVQTLKMDINK